MTPRTAPGQERALGLAPQADSEVAADGPHPLSTVASCSLCPGQAGDSTIRLVAGETLSPEEVHDYSCNRSCSFKKLKKNNKKTHDKSHACQSLPPSLSDPIMNSWHFLLRVNYTLYERYRASFDISFPRWALTLSEDFLRSLPLPQGRRSVWPGLPSALLSARRLGAYQSW